MADGYYADVVFQEHTFHIMNSVAWVKRYNINKESNTLYQSFEKMYKAFLRIVYEESLYNEYIREGKKISLNVMKEETYASNDTDKYEGRFKVFVLVYPGDTPISLNSGVNVVKGQAIAFVSAQHLKLKANHQSINDFFKEVVYLSEIMKFPGIQGGAARILFNYLHSEKGPWRNKLIFLEVNPAQPNVQRLKTTYLEWGFVPSWMCFIPDVLRNERYSSLKAIGEFLEKEREEGTLAYTMPGQDSQTILLNRDNDDLKKTNHIFIFFPWIKEDHKSDDRFIERLIESDGKFNTVPESMKGLFRAHSASDALFQQITYPDSIQKEKRSRNAPERFKIESKKGRKLSSPLTVKHVYEDLSLGMDEGEGGVSAEEIIISHPRSDYANDRDKGLSLEAIGSYCEGCGDSSYDRSQYPKPPFPPKYSPYHTAVDQTKRRRLKESLEHFNFSEIAQPDVGEGGGTAITPESSIGEARSIELFNERNRILIENASDKVLLERCINEQNAKLKRFQNFKKYFAYDWEITKVKYVYYDGKYRVHEYTFQFNHSDWAGHGASVNVRFHDIVFNSYIFQRKAIMAIVDFHENNEVSDKGMKWGGGNYTNLNALKNVYDNKNLWDALIRDSERYPFERNSDVLDIKYF